MDRNIEGNDKDKALAVHAMKAYSWRTGTAPFILNPGTG
jgi:hypothetical protein